LKGVFESQKHDASGQLQRWCQAGHTFVFCMDLKTHCCEIAERHPHAGHGHGGLSCGQRPASHANTMFFLGGG